MSLLLTLAVIRPICVPQAAWQRLSWRRAWLRFWLPEPCRPFLYAAIEFVNAGDQGVNVFSGRHAELVQGLGDTFFEDVFELVPLVAGFGLDVGGHVGHLVGGFGDFFFGDSLGLALDGQAFLDECFKHFAAFFLRLGECTQASQPDLLG